MDITGLKTFVENKYSGKESLFVPVKEIVDLLYYISDDIPTDLLFSSALLKITTHTDTTYEEIEKLFGKNVLKIVKELDAFSDSPTTNIEKLSEDARTLILATILRDANSVLNYENEIDKDTDKYILNVVNTIRGINNTSEINTILLEKIKYLLVLLKLKYL